MIYLALLLILSACGETPTGPSGPYGRIETFAGTGDAGKGPEEAPPLQALFYLPQDLTYGPMGGFTSSTGTTTESASPTRPATRRDSRTRDTEAAPSPRTTSRP